MIGIQIEFSDSSKEVEIFSHKTKDFVQHISDRVREIHKKISKLKIFVVIFTDTMVNIQIQLECN